jgi:hypothetical protein
MKPTKLDKPKVGLVACGVESRNSIVRIPDTIAASIGPVVSYVSSWAFQSWRLILVQICAHVDTAGWQEHKYCRSAQFMKNREVGCGHYLYQNKTRNMEQTPDNPLFPQCSHFFTLFLPDFVEVVVPCLCCSLPLLPLASGAPCLCSLESI